eukprot:COSAG06_NODE_679_length_13142_cov_15.143832_15_plen_74_part_00
MFGTPARVASHTLPLANAADLRHVSAGKGRAPLSHGSAGASGGWLRIVRPALFEKWSPSFLSAFPMFVTSLSW